VTSGAVKLEFPATTINEGMLIATDKWRVLVEDPEAILPWSAHLEFYEAPASNPDDGGRMTKLQSMCQVTIEFDRKVVDELTGASGSAE
jgi:hypothetical protein